MAWSALGVDDVNRPSAVGKKSSRGSGRRTVIYRDAAGRTWSALVVAKGSSSGLKLKIESAGNVRVIDNVALATTFAQTNRYRNSLA